MLCIWLPLLDIDDIRRYHVAVNSKVNDSATPMTRKMDGILFSPQGEPYQCSWTNGALMLAKQMTDSSKLG